jgi:hypothetical protein
MGKNPPNQTKPNHRSYIFEFKTKGISYEIECPGTAINVSHVLKIQGKRTCKILNLALEQFVFYRLPRPAAIVN